jgi:hypothetical protein
MSNPQETKNTDNIPPAAAASTASDVRASTASTAAAAAAAPSSANAPASTASTAAAAAAAPSSANVPAAVSLKQKYLIYTDKGHPVTMSPTAQSCFASVDKHGNLQVLNANQATVSEERIYRMQQVQTGAKTSQLSVNDDKQIFYFCAKPQYPLGANSVSYQIVYILLLIPAKYISAT